MGVCMTILQSERLLLRPLEHGDLAALTAIFADHDHMWDLMDIPGRSNDPATLASFYLERSLWAFDRYGGGMWAILDRAASASLLLGYTGFVIDIDEEIDVAKEIEAGWAMASGNTGKGIALEATAALFDHTFDQLGSAKISAVTSPDNHASRHLMDRLGMIHERDITAYQGRQVVYVVGRDAWRQKRAEITSQAALPR
jgi:[ribosomal protein S5]-alanine N-acetyltransferase